MAIDTVDTRISVGDLAEELGRHKQSVFKVISRLNISVDKKRDPDRGNQLVATISSLEANTVRSAMLRTQKEDALEYGEFDDGLFYIVQLEPKHDPGRIKLGFTTDLDARLQKHRCVAPFVQCIKTWPCKKTWERTVMDCVTQSAERLHTEVFRVDELEALLQKAEAFFDMMPVIQSISEPLSHDVQSDE